jgi:hypothetical protein
MARLGREGGQGVPPGASSDDAELHVPSPVGRASSPVPTQRLA